MAQKIQFVYLSQSDYDNLDPKNAGRIYFTSDTHRIYKGSDLYAATTFDQLNFSQIQASGVVVNGKAVSLEGHGHSVADIDGLATAIASASNFASIGHTHSISDIASLSSILTGITSSSLTKDVVNASTVSASTITANVGEFDTLYVNGDADFEVNNVDANAVTVNGTNVALEGHTHSVADISDFASAISLATSDFASASHTHVIGDIQSLTAKVSGLTSNKVSKTNAEFTNLSADNADLTSISASTATFETLVVTGDVTMSLSEVTFGSIVAYDIQVGGTSVALVGHSHSEYATASHSHLIADISGLSEVLTGITSSSLTKDTGTFTSVNASTATFGDINVTGTASLSTTNIVASTLTAGAGSFTSLTVVGSSVSLEGHTHSQYAASDHSHDGVYASISHSHSISDVSGLSDILSGITSSSIEKDTVTANVGYFTMLSVSGSASFRINTVSANSVTVNGTNVALEGHGHSIADISGLQTELNEFASSGHTHLELAGITSTSISKDSGDFGSVAASTVTANTGTFSTISASQITVGGSSVSLEGHVHSIYALSSHSHDELAGITSNAITKTTGTFDTVTASTATFESLNVTSSATFDITNLVADAITVSDLNLTGTLSVSSTAISSMTVVDLSVTNSLKLNNKDIATQEYVQAMISQAIGQILASAY